MLNEKQKLAPDRAANSFGSDNNYEYKLYGQFSGDTVYEPASNGMYPEFSPEKLRTNFHESAADFQEPSTVARKPASVNSIEKPE